MRTSEKILATLFIVASLLHAGICSFLPGVPAWKMFRSVPRYAYQLEDSKGQSIDIHDYVPARAYTLAMPVAPFRIAEWLAEKEPERLPLSGTILVGRGAEMKRASFVLHEPEYPGSPIRKELR